MTTTHPTKENTMPPKSNTAAPVAAGTGTREQAIADRLDHLFRYHAPTEATLPKYAAINAAAQEFARVVLTECPDGADQSAALRLIREARMTANASVALDGRA